MHLQKFTTRQLQSLKTGLNVNEHVYSRRNCATSIFTNSKQTQRGEPASSDSDLYVPGKQNILLSSLTPDACALVGDVVLQFGPEPSFSPSASHTPIVHQQEGLVVVVQAARVTRRVLDVVLRRKASLYHIIAVVFRNRNVENM